MNDKNQLLERKISFFSILKFTLPSIAMMVIMSLYTVVDGTFVSRLIGTDAFSAVNIVYPLLSLTIGIGTMFGTGTAAIVSQKLGEGKHKAANQIFSFIILVTIFIGIVLSLLSFAFLKQILYLLGSDAEIFHYCHEYALPLVLFFPANILQIQFQNLYAANGKPQVGLIVTIIGGAANIILDYIFIAKLGMGIQGAAIATGIGYAIPAVYGLFYFSINKKGLLHFVKPKINWNILCHAAANGSSEMVNYLSTSITTFLFNIIMMRLIGKDGVAAIAILLYMDFVLVSVTLGYSIGAAPLISYNYGCQNTIKVRKLFQISIQFCTIISVTITAGTIIFSKQLTSIFTPKDSSVFELAASGLVIYAFSYLFKSFNIFSSAMFTAFGNGKISAILSFMRTLVFLVLSLVLLSAIFKVSGVWYAAPFAETLAFILSSFFVFRHRKQYHYFLLKGESEH